MLNCFLNISLQSLRLREYRSLRRTREEVGRSFATNQPSSTLVHDEKAIANGGRSKITFDDLATGMFRCNDSTPSTKAATSSFSFTYACCLSSQFPYFSNISFASFIRRHRKIAFCSRNFVI